MIHKVIAKEGRCIRAVCDRPQHSLCRLVVWLQIQGDLNLLYCPGVRLGYRKGEREKSIVSAGGSAGRSD
jgi:hypothetical protein